MAIEERQLNGLEKFLDAVDLVAPINFTLMVTLTGPLSLKVLSTAAKLTCLKLPASLLVPHNRGTHRSFFKKSPFFPRIEVASSLRLDRAVSHAINHRFDLNREAPIRLKWQPSETQHIILITFLHTAADGASGLQWLNTLVESINQLIDGTHTQHQIEPIEKTVIENLDLPSDPISDSAATRKLAGAKFAKSRSTAVLGIEFTEAETKRIFDTINSRNLSVNTVLSAAHLRSVSCLFGEPASMSLSFPVDLRRGRGLPADAYGCFVSEARIEQKVNAKASTIALSRRLDRVLRDAVEMARPWNERLTLPIDPKRIYESRATTALSNLGHYTPTPSNHISIHRVGFAVGCSVLGDQVLTVLTTNGKMTCMFCWTVDTATPAQISEVGRRFRENVLDL